MGFPLVGAIRLIVFPEDDVPHGSEVRAGPLYPLLLATPLTLWLTLPDVASLGGSDRLEDGRGRMSNATSAKAIAVRPTTTAASGPAMDRRRGCRDTVRESVRLPVRRVLGPFGRLLRLLLTVFSSGRAAEKLASATAVAQGVAPLSVSCVIYHTGVLYERKHFLPGGPGRHVRRAGHLW